MDMWQPHSFFLPGGGQITILYIQAGEQQTGSNLVFSSCLRGNSDSELLHKILPNSREVQVAVQRVEGGAGRLPAPRGAEHAAATQGNPSCQGLVRITASSIAYEHIPSIFYLHFGLIFNDQQELPRQWLIGIFVGGFQLKSK